MNLEDIERKGLSAPAEDGWQLVMNNQSSVKIADQVG
jgi:hypothetical protein